MGQVLRHGESTELQYRLVEHAIQLGWPRERVQVIDDDLGLSGQSGAARQGFQFLIAEVGWGRAGLAMSYDPRLYQDRLILGLTGLMSKAELHQIRMRPHAGRQQKAQRGELRIPLPAGLWRQLDAQVVLHPDKGALPDSRLANLARLVG
jgi:hypothetical protein